MPASAWIARCGSSASGASRPTFRSSKTWSTTRVFQHGEATTRFLDDTPQLFQFTPRKDRATKLLTYIADVTVNGNKEVAGKPRPKSFRQPPIPPHDSRPGAERHAPAPPEARAREVREVDARADAAADDRHHLPRRAPVADGDAGPHLRHDGAGELRRAPPAQPVQPGDVGRRDLRRDAALPARGPLGEAVPPAPGDSEHLLPDALPRLERRRVHRLPRQRGPRVRARRPPPKASTSSASSIR